jgi:uncharacterized membrane protein YeaQ/YmgE (transglycosylase-associated protein family)
MIISIIGWLIIGLIIGGLARLIMPGRDPMGCLATALLGIAGSFVGGLIGRMIWPMRAGEYAHPSFLLSLLGAVILLWLWRMIRSQ